eukprot:6404859-Amphidinium_carterae.1
MCRTRLTLDVYPEKAQCRYIRNAATAACGALLQGSGSHAHSCCRRLIMSRHAQLCYAIANACRQAGWNVLLEQDVVRGLDQPSKREGNARRTKCTDLTDVGGI